MSHCPCQSKLSYVDCCGQYLSGKQSAPTAEKLMRSRYTAHARQDVNYILKTWAEPFVNQVDKISLRKWLKKSKFIELTIIDTQDGLENHHTGIVEFRAVYINNKKQKVIHERSEFVKQDGQWLYTKGEA